MPQCRSTLIGMSSEEKQLGAQVNSGRKGDMDRRSTVERVSTVQVNRAKGEKRRECMPRCLRVNCHRAILSRATVV